MSGRERTRKARRVDLRRRAGGTIGGEGAAAMLPLIALPVASTAGRSWTRVLALALAAAAAVRSAHYRASRSLYS